MAYPPTLTSVTDQWQLVYWSPDLYRWDGYRWAVLNLPRGYYAVRDYYRWGATQHYASGSFVLRASTWAPNVRNGSSFCHLP